MNKTSARVDFMQLYVIRTERQYSGRFYAVARQIIAI